MIDDKINQFFCQCGEKFPPGNAQGIEAEIPQPPQKVPGTFWGGEELKRIARSDPAPIRRWV
jgi:hypothetical protein